MKLTCYALNANPLTLRPAPHARAWVEQMPDKHAYRCLPVSIANSHGWEILSPCDFEIAWTGGLDVRDITLRALDGYRNLGEFVSSHFQYGIVTFHVSYLFRTEPGWNLFASGSLNSPKDGIAPLTGIIETDWLPYPFTMNWQMTRPGKVRFAKGEPICMVFPVPHGAVQTVEPEIVNLDDDPEFMAQVMAWKARRDEFVTKQRANDAETWKQGWQRFYFVGKMPDGTSVDAGHVNKLRLAEPVDKRGQKRS